MIARALFCLSVVLAGWMLSVPAGAADNPASGGPLLCVPPSPAPGPLPVFPHLASLNETQLARFAYPFALMALDARSPGNNNVAAWGYVRGPNANELFVESDLGAAAAASVVGFFGASFIHCSTGTLVVVIRSTSPYDPRDLVSGVFRHYFTHGYSDLVLRFYDLVAARYPGYPIMVVGHSSGGGLASYLAGQRGAPSVVFNGTRSDAALTNPGTNQLVVIVEGDRIADVEVDRPGAVGGTLNGVTLRMDTAEDYSTWVRHWISTVISELERRVR